MDGIISTSELAKSLNISTNALWSRAKVRGIKQPKNGFYLETDIVNLQTKQVIYVDKLIKLYYPLKTTETYYIIPSKMNYGLD